MSASYYLWSGVGPIIDGDDEPLSNLDEAVRSLRTSLTGDWTLWCREDGRARLLGWHADTPGGRVLRLLSDAANQGAELKFVVRKSLASRSNSGHQLQDAPVSGVLLVGEAPALEWWGCNSGMGRDYCSLYPAVHDGKYCWLVAKRWHAAPGQAGLGSEDLIISFETGVRFFVERGVFPHAVSCPEVARGGESCPASP